MKPQYYFLRATLLLLLLLQATASVWAQRIVDSDGYYYDKYHVQMTVHADNSYSILEQIDIVFTTPKHGIYRSLITDSWIMRDVSAAQDGSKTELRHYEPKIKNIEVSVPFKVFDEEGVKDVRIGSSDSYYDGPVHFDISYRMEVPSDRVEQSDLFFYSLLGTGEPCSTRYFSFCIDFEQPVPDSSLRALQMFTGALGSGDDVSSQIITTCTPTHIEGSVDFVRPYEAVTLWLPLPEGYFPVITPWQTYVAWISLLLAIIVLLYVLYKELQQRDRVTKVVTFDPPHGMNSAEVGTLIDCSVDDRDLISLIPWLANEGYLRIKKEDNGHTVLKKLDKETGGLPDYVQKFYDALFANGPLFDVTEPTSRQFGAGWLSAREKIDKRMSDKLNELDGRSFGWLMLGIVFAGMAAAWGSTVHSSWYFGLMMMLSLGFAALVIWLSCYNTPVVLWIALPIALLPIAYFSGYEPDIIVNVIREFVYGMIGFDCFGPHYCDVVDDLYVPRLAYDGLLLFAIVVACLSFRLHHLSDYRRKYLGELQGLREFIMTAEKDRLKMLLEQDEQYFYRILPFAVVFGLAKEWTAKFEGLTLADSSAYRHTNFDDLLMLNRLAGSDNFRHGIMSEQQAREEAAAKARRQASSGSSSSSSRSYGGGGRGYSGGGFGGGGSRSW